MTDMKTRYDETANSIITEDGTKYESKVINNRYRSCDEVYEMHQKLTALDRNGDFGAIDSMLNGEGMDVHDQLFVLDTWADHVESSNQYVLKVGKEYRETVKRHIINEALSHDAKGRALFIACLYADRNDELSSVITL